MRIKKQRVYWDSCVVIAYITGEPRPDNEMDGVHDCSDDILRGKTILVSLRDVIFEEVQLRTVEAAEKFRQLYKRSGIELVSIDLRIERLAAELRRYYETNGPKEMRERDSLHLAAAIHYKVDAFYTFDRGKKGGVNLLSLSGNVAGFPLIITKPPVAQYRLL